MCNVLSYYLLLFCLGFKLNSLILVDLFIQKVYTGRWLHHMPQIYIVLICHRVIELSLQVINASNYSHTQDSLKKCWLIYVTDGTKLVCLARSRNACLLHDERAATAGCCLKCAVFGG